MEEDKKVEQNDELKREVESKAKQNNSLDEKTAVVNENNKIVDIDTVLSDPTYEKINTKVKNLSKIGFGIEYIKKLITIKSNFSVGSSEQELVDEIDKITKMLIQTISDNANGIKLNEDGSKDEIASEEQQKIINAGSDVYSQSYMLTKVSADEIWDIVASKINTIEVDKPIDIQDYLPYIREKSNARNTKKINDDYSINNIDTTSNDKLADDVYIDIGEKDDIALLAMYKLRKAINGNLSSEQFKEALENFEKVVQKSPSKFLKEFKDSDENSYREKISSKLDKFEKDKNKVDIISDLESLKEVRYECLSKEEKYRFISALVRSDAFKEDKQIAFLRDSIVNRNGIKITLKDLIPLAQEVTDNIFESSSDLKKYFEVDNFSEDTCEKFMKKYRAKDRNIKFDKSMSAREKKDYYIFNDYKEKAEGDCLPIYQKSIYLRITNEIEETISGGNKDGILELFQVYIDCIENNTTENQEYRKILEGYIKSNKDQIEQYVNLNYPKVNGIFCIKDKSAEIIETTKGIKSNSIKELIKGHEFSENSKQRINLYKESILKSYTLEMKDEREKDSQRIVDIHETLKRKPLSEKDKEKLKNLLYETNIYSFMEEDLKVLKSLKSDEIFSILEDKFIDTLKNDGLITYNEDINVNLNIYEKIIENVLMWESKIENTKGTPEYLEIVQKRDQLYKTNANYLQILSKIRDESGNLTRYGQNQINEYNEKILNEKISAEINILDISKVTAENREAYTSLLLVGAGFQNELQVVSVQKLSELYPELAKQSKGNLKELIYSKTFGKEYESNKELISSVYEKLKKNVFDQVINERKTLKVSDSEIEDFLNSNIVDMDISKINFSKSQFQNLFKNSKVDFSEKDENIFQQLYNSTILNSHIESKEEAIERQYLTLFQINEEINVNKDTLRSKRMNAHLASILNENPQLEESIFNKNGKVRTDKLEDNKKFKKNFLYSEILSNAKKIIENSKDFEKMDRKEKINLLENGLLLYKMSKFPKTNDDAKNMMEKLSIAIFEKMNSADKSFVEFNSKGNAKLNDEEILNVIHDENILGGKKYKSLEKLSNNIYENFFTYRMYSCIKPYEYLDNDDFIKLEGNSTEEKVLQSLQNRGQMNHKVKEARINFAKESIVDREYDILKSRLLNLSEEDIKNITNPTLLAIWYKNKIDYYNGNSPGKMEQYNDDFKKRTSNDKNVDDTLIEFKQKLKESISETKYKDTEKNEEKLSKILGITDYKEILEMSKNRTINDILYYSKREGKNGEKLSSRDWNAQIRNFRKEDIDKFDDRNISTIWYNTEIQKLHSKGLAVENLENEFSEKFGITVEESMKELKEKSSRIIDDKNSKNSKYSVEDIAKALIGERATDFVEKNSIANKMIFFRKYTEVQKILRTDIKEDFTHETKIEYLANIYSYVMDKDLYSSGSDNSKSEGVKLYIERNKKEFPEFFDENQKFDYKKVIGFATKTKEKTPADSIGEKISRKIDTLNKNEEKDRIKYDNVIGFLNTDKDLTKEEFDKVYEDAKELLNKKIIPTDFIKNIKDKNPDLGNRLQRKIRERKKDTWIGLATRTVNLAGKSIKYLPMLFKGKESRKEYLNMISEHLSSGIERIEGQTEKTAEKINETRDALLTSVGSLVGSNKGIFGLFKRKTKKLNPGKEEKSLIEQKSVNKEDNVINSQQSPSIQDVFKDTSYRYADVGVYQKFEEQKLQESQKVQQVARPEDESRQE